MPTPAATRLSNQGCAGRSEGPPVIGSPPGLNHFRLHQTRRHAMTTMTRRSEHLLALASGVLPAQPGRGFSGDRRCRGSMPTSKLTRRDARVARKRRKGEGRNGRRSRPERSKRADEDEAGGVGSPGSEPGVAIGPMDGGKGSGDRIQEEDRESKLARLRNAGVRGGMLRFALKTGGEIAALNRAPGENRRPSVVQQSFPALLRGQSSCT